MIYQIDIITAQQSANKIPLDTTGTVPYVEWTVVGCKEVQSPK